MITDQDLRASPHCSYSNEQICVEFIYCLHGVMIHTRVFDVLLVDDLWHSDAATYWSTAL